MVERESRCEAEEALRRAQEAERLAAEQHEEATRLADFLKVERVQNHFAERFMDFRRRKGLS